ncbi:ROK family transcriptional regulator [Lachnospiraceae bacterium LCP25S3_G4]
MKRSTNNIEVKKINRNRVFRYINNREQACMPEISSALEMSGPTVLTIVNELKEAGVIREVGEFQSTGGRKAKAIAAVQDVKYATGIEITKNHISLVLTNLSESVLKHMRIRKTFSYDEKYLKELGDLVQEFVSDVEEANEKMVGIGISVPAIVRGEENCTSNSHALGVHHMSREEFEKYIPYPCMLINDANSAATAEISRNENQKSMVYLSLSNTVGGAIVFAEGEGTSYENSAYGQTGTNMFMGHNWHSAEFGHMVIDPKGKTCYCGKKGCLDAYCSTLNLSNCENGSLECFFQKLGDGDQKCKEVWDEYLEYLAIGVDNLKMCFDCDVVIGGYVGDFIGPYLEQLEKKVTEKNIFQEDGKYVRGCKHQANSTALGAAIFQIEKFIDSI